MLKTSVQRRPGGEDAAVCGLGRLLRTWPLVSTLVADVEHTVCEDLELDSAVEDAVGDAVRGGDLELVPGERNDPVMEPAIISELDIS